MLPQEVREPLSLPAHGLAATWARLEDQLAWYDRHARSSQAAFRGVQVVVLVLASAVPLLVVASAPRWSVALAGTLVAVLEGVQQLFKHQEHWLLYRSTCEGLKQERHLFLAGAGPYAGPERERVLAERVEALVSRESDQWRSTHRQPEGRTSTDG